MRNPSQHEVSMQSGQSAYERMLQECLRGELRVVNRGLPQRREQLAILLNQRYPHVVCNDGSMHSFKRSELEYLATMLDTAEQRTLLLPMLIELGVNQDEAAIICQAEVEQKIVSMALNMPVKCEDGRIRIYKPQLALLRKKFKTATVYVFSPKFAA
jgi:uncharacterized protein (UPF0216 family)